MKKSLVAMGLLTAMFIGTQSFAACGCSSCCSNSCNTFRTMSSCPCQKVIQPCCPAVTPCPCPVAAPCCNTGAACPCPVVAPCCTTGAAAPCPCPKAECNDCCD